MKVMSIIRLTTFLSSLRSLTQSLTMLSSATSEKKDYYRSDGVRITHDPYTPYMIEKYGEPGQTDNEGFDPYRDSVGAGIYGGIVKRDALGKVVIGQQYQNHNPRPGPVYAGGGYTPIVKALKDENTLVKLLEKYPDLANDVTTGGAQPLHMCGMSQVNQHVTSTLIKYGGDIEALDTYGMTPLHRMASNNLPVGTKALLEAGADPNNTGLVGATPSEIAMDSRALDVYKVLTSTKRRKEIYPSHVTIEFDSKSDKEISFVLDLKGKYKAMSSSTIPKSFDKVCIEQGWNTNQMWKRLNDNNVWYQHTANDSYIYYNNGDGKWWIDGSDGLGVFTNNKGVVRHTVPAHGWVPLRASGDDVIDSIEPIVHCFRSKE